MTEQLRVNQFHQNTTFINIFNEIKYCLTILNYTGRIAFMSKYKVIIYMVRQNTFNTFNKIN